MSDFRTFNNKGQPEAAKSIEELRSENAALREKMRSETEKLQLVLNASLELSNERDSSKLCDKILTTMRSLCQAEGASLYLADVEKNTLHSSHVQNEKIKAEYKHFVLPIDEASMAGACASRKKIIHVEDVNRISVIETFKFNQKFDEKSSYKTKSLLSFPILKSTEELVGVIQLVNSKRADGFTEEDIEVGKVLSVHIAVSLETALLYQDIEKLFEGFIKASVTAIESRDPTTSGHSERVAKYTVKLAEAVSLNQQPKFKDIRFADAELKQLRYASLLHDFGKIGVPELVLLKEKKLFPAELKEIELRMKLLRLSHPDKAAELNQLWQAVLRANEPTVLAEELKDDLSKFIDVSYKVLEEQIPIITKNEWVKLSIPKGSLSPKDREQIESHVSHTFKFLSQIPWTKGLKSVPSIARSHHEKLDGTGYPQKLKSEAIPFESQIMAITDIYDALTAPDRPYKKSVPEEKALAILFEDASRGKINKDLVQLFSEQKVYKIG
ncbi:MAG: metal dependent phosphohydrolase [Bacteriovoracaceae bacterium]|nr:metal dependent phosphohydrolase [Bacteriovoracaceae bacterium]